MVTSQADSTSSPQNNQPTDDEFVRLLLQYQRLLFVHLRMILDSPADADEVLQETCFIVWQKRHTFVLGTNFVNWAMTIAQYAVRKFRRNQKHVLQIFGEELLDQITVEMAAEYDLLEARHWALAECVETLNERDRNLVSAAYNSSSPLKDVSQGLGMTLSGFRKALYRIRQRLLKCVQRRLAAEGIA